MMASPRHDPSPWANMQANGYPQHMTPAPEPLNVKPADRQHQWENSQLPNNDFVHMQPLPMVSGLPDGDVGNFEFMHLPTQEEWNSWHSASYSMQPPNIMPGSMPNSVPHSVSSNDASELDGMPPRGQYNANHFTSPGMGGTMNG